MGAALRATVVVVAVMVDSGCGINRDGFNGYGQTIPPNQAAAERDMRSVLVDVFHADPDDADCLVAEAYRSPSVNRDPT